MGVLERPKCIEQVLHQALVLLDKHQTLARPLAQNTKPHQVLPPIEIIYQ